LASMKKMRRSSRPVVMEKNAGGPSGQSTGERQFQQGSGCCVAFTATK
jgi:hypothetical protein